jgi:hypothetical protein
MNNKDAKRNITMNYERVGFNLDCADMSALCSTRHVAWGESGVIAAALQNASGKRMHFNLENYELQTSW